MNNEKDNREAVRKKFPLRARFEYWFDNRMAKGSLGLIRALIIASLTSMPGCPPLKTAARVISPL